MKYFILIIICLFFYSCFEYEETIYFNKGFSGYVEISYTVPINTKTRKSMIKFLPLNSDEIANKINKSFSSNLIFKDFSLRYLEKIEKSNVLFKDLAKVNYKIEFSDFSQLENILFGSLYVKRKNNSINIKREFKSLPNPIDPTSISIGEKKIRSEILRLLGDGFILFRVIFPPASDCRSTLGDVNTGQLYYKLPLADTIEKTGNKSWDYKITIYY